MSATGLIEYSSNNSGGSWWLDDADWHALEAAGWIVHWVHDPHDPSHEHDEPVDERYASLGGHTHAYTDPLLPSAPSGERWLGCIAKSAAKATNDPAVAVAEWAKVTGEDPSAEGCNCCGEPHNFTFTTAEGERQYSFVEVTSTALRWS